MSLTSISSGVSESRREGWETARKILIEKFPGSSWHIDDTGTIEGSMDVPDGSIGIIVTEPGEDFHFYYHLNSLPASFTGFHLNNPENDIAAIDDIRGYLQKDERDEHRGEYVYPEAAQLVLGHSFIPKGETDPEKICSAFYEAVENNIPQCVLDVLVDSEKAQELVRLHPDFVEKTPANGLHKNKSRWKQVVADAIRNGTIS